MRFTPSARSSGSSLLVLALLSIVINILLFFPNGETRFASEHRLNKYVEALPGIVGGGLLVLIPAAAFLRLHDDSCGSFGREGCGKSRPMLSLILAAFVGLLGAGYCITASAVGLAQEPYCFTQDRNQAYPFPDFSGRYSFECQEPQNVLQWNLILFSTLTFLGGIEFVICLVQLINYTLGGQHGLCRNQEEV
ncbi:T4S1 protein, partial [Ptilonorhynchus violaceus]|nr:T4S1 protein [Ptilonorhynchus violaceus]